MTHPHCARCDHRVRPDDRRGGIAFLWCTVCRCWAQGAVWR